MKTKLLLAGIVIIGMTSCKGSSGKRVFEESKGAVERAYKEYKAFSESDAGRYQKLRRYQRQFEEMQQSSPCWQCQGWGVVGYVDENGYFMTDYNGNILTATCPECGGTGRN